MTNWLSRIATERSGRERSLGRILLIAGVVFMGFLVVSVIGYRVVEPTYSWLDAVYMTVITVATVGFNEVRPLGDAGRFWTMFVIVGGVITGAVVMSLVVATLVEGSIRGIFGRRHLEKQIAALSDHTMLCGYGRTGQRIAIELQ